MNNTCTHRYKKNTDPDAPKGTCLLADRLPKGKLPMDKENKCIFHSANLAWKKKNKFVHWLEKLVATYDVTEKNYLIDFHFIADKSENTIGYLRLLQNASLNGGIFYNEVLVENMTDVFGSFEFEDCTFSKGLCFVHCEFHSSFTLSNITISKDKSDVSKLLFENCHFEHYLTWKNCYEFLAHVTFHKCTFDEELVLQELYCKKGGSFEFLDCGATINDVDFNKVILCDWIDFSRSVFKTATFKHCTFDGQTSFNQIQCLGNMYFHGNEEHSIFSGATAFDIDFKEFEGELDFQHCNISNIRKTHKDILLETEKHTDGKVTIGSGCIKYRNVSPDFTYDLKKQHRQFVLSIGGSFANYFSQTNGFNLGIEVRHKTQKEVTLFYYSDEDIDNEKFVELLLATSKKAFQLLDPDYDIQKDEEYNFCVDVDGTFSKVMRQLKQNDWAMDNSRSLLQTIFFSPNIDAITQAFHKLLEKGNSDQIARTIQLNFKTIIQNHGNKPFIVGNLQTNQLSLNAPNDKAARNEKK